jgi:galactokinase
VLPVAIDRETIVAAAARSDRRIRVYSTEKKSPSSLIWIEPGQSKEVSGKTTSKASRRRFSRTVRSFAEPILRSHRMYRMARTFVVCGARNSVGFALLSLSGAAIDRVRLALAGQQAEHQYVGTKSGIMDQFISAMGEKTMRS